MMAALSLARSTLRPASIALAIGGFTVPDDEPGVADGMMGGAVDGSPSPGVRFVVQPNTAREATITAAANPRKPPRKSFVSLRILPPVVAASFMVIESNVRASGGGEVTGLR